MSAGFDGEGDDTKVDDGFASAASGARTSVAAEGERIALPSFHRTDDPRLGGDTTTEVRPTLQSRYQLMTSLGRGGMGEVFLAIAPERDGSRRLVVVKTMRAERTADIDVTMFLDEARLALRLHHPNVVATYDVGSDDGQLFFVMEYLEGQSLARIQAARRETGRRMPPGMACRIAADVLAGLHHAHELVGDDGVLLNVVHRDVSPQNIFVTYDGRTKLLDFGIAKAAVGAETKAEFVKGKIGYMAPEHALGIPVDRRADVFAVGIVLWELLTGSPLSEAADNVQSLVRLLSEPMPLLSTVVPGVDPRLEAIVARALSRQAGDRYPTALAMRQDLEAYLAAAAGPWHEPEIAEWMNAAFAVERLADVRRDREYLGLPPVAERPAHGSTHEAAKVAGREGAATPPRPTMSRNLMLLCAGAITVFVVLMGLGMRYVGQSLGTPIAASETYPIPQSAMPGGTARFTPAMRPEDLAPARKVHPPDVVLPDGGSPFDLLATSDAGIVAEHLRAYKNGGFLSLDAPAPLEVSLDAKPIGVTPITRFPVLPGKHTLVAVNPKTGAKQKMRVTIVKGKELSKHFTAK